MATSKGIIIRTEWNNEMSPLSLVYRKPHRNDSNYPYYILVAHSTQWKLYNILNYV